MINNLLIFVGTTFLVLVVPGPDFVLVTRNTLTGSRAQGYLTALGICASLVFLTALTATGVAAVIAQNDTMSTALRIAGGSYLLLLAWQLIGAARGRQAEAEAPVLKAAEPIGRGTTAVAAPPRQVIALPLVQGFLNNVLNPKALIFYLTFLPQFLDPARQILGQALLLGFLVVCCAAVWWGLYITIIGRLGRVMAKRSVRMWIDAGAGAALGALGVFILFGQL